MEWVERGDVFDERTCEAAAKGGQLCVLTGLRERGCPWDKRTCIGAAECGHLPLEREDVHESCAGWTPRGGIPLEQDDVCGGVFDGCTVSPCSGGSLRYKKRS